MSSVEDDDLVENESSRVMGIGAGTFTVGFLFFATVVVYLLTSPQVGPVKHIMRTTMVLISVAVIMILVFADRESQYQNQTEEVKDYDDSIGPRIAIGVMMLFTTLISAMLIFFNHWNVAYEVSSQNVDNIALWQQ